MTGGLVGIWCALTAGMIPGCFGSEHVDVHRLHATPALRLAHSSYSHARGGINAPLDRRPDAPLPAKQQQAHLNGAGGFVCSFNGSTGSQPGLAPQVKPQGCYTTKAIVTFLCLTQPLH